MFRKFTQLVLLSVFMATLSPSLIAVDRLKASELLQLLIANESLSDAQYLADTLSEYTLDDFAVQKLIDAAEGTHSDPRRNVYWHAIRYSRSRLGRDYLLKKLPSAALPLRVEFIESLQNPAAFDVPLYVAIYESAESESATDEASLREFFLRFAFSRWYDSRTTSWKSTADSKLYHNVGNRRKADADMAQIRLITYLVTHGHNLDARIAAFEYKGHSWFKGFEMENHLRMAEQLLATAETPAERARLVSTLRRQIPPSRYLRNRELLEVKLAAIAAIAENVEEGWQGTGGYTYLRQAFQDLLPLTRDEDQSELARAASRMIRALEIRYGEKAVKD